MKLWIQKKEVLSIKWKIKKLFLNAFWSMEVFTQEIEAFALDVLE